MATMTEQPKPRSDFANWRIRTSTTRTAWMYLLPAFLVMGLIAELMVRTYYESQNKTVYYIRQVLPAEDNTLPRLDPS